MRVALLHNASAGSEDHTDEELVRMIDRAGHEVVHVVSRVSDLTEALQSAPCDMVAVAGGDGTVGRAACELSEWRLPIAILPLGTANNTARTLSLPARLKKLIQSWQGATQRPFDVGSLDDGSVRQLFSEAAGWGVFARTIADAKKRTEHKSRARQLHRDRKLFRASLERTRPRFYEIEVDGRDCSGEYLLVEVMNVPLLGPRLELSPTSDPGDGTLELVLAGESERAMLDELARTGSSPEQLRCERGSALCVRCDDELAHRDGKLLRYAPGHHDFSIRLRRGAITYLR